MLRTIHALPGVVAGLLVAVLAVSGAILSLVPVTEHIKAGTPRRGEVSAAALAEAVAAQHPGTDRIVRTAGGSVIVSYFKGEEPAMDLVDPVSGSTIAPYEPSRFVALVTSLHRSLLLGEAGRAVAGIGALAMVMLAISGTMMLATRLGGWTMVLRPARGTTAQRLHLELARFALSGLLLSGLTGCYLLLASFDLLPDGSAGAMMPPASSEGAPRAAVGALPALRNVDLVDVRELTFPSASDPSDVYTLKTGQGVGSIDAVSGEMLAYQPNSQTQRLYETIYMLHTGAGLWPLALVLGVTALAVPLLAVSGGLVWWRRRKALPRIAQNRGAQAADTIILVGSEGNGTWGFAATLHQALTATGHRVHTAPMNTLAARYRRARRLLILTATHGNGDAPTSAGRFLARLEGVENPLPFAVLGFGDRTFPRFCRFAEDVEAALRARRWPSLLPLRRIDRQAERDFAEWGHQLGAALGEPLTLTHAAARPRTVALELVERLDYGAEVQAPTAILRFIPATGPKQSRQWQSQPRLPRFEAGDLVGILAPGAALPRYYSLASSASEGVLEICVRKQPGGTCSCFLHELSPGDRIEAFIRPNTAFRPGRGRTPLILIGAGTGIAPFAGFIRHNVNRRPVHLYWGCRHPWSDFLYEDDLAAFVSDRRLTRLNAAFSRVARGAYVQDLLADDTRIVRGLVQAGAQIFLCGGRDMAAGVRTAIETILGPIGLDIGTLRTGGRYVEDVY